jgi:hypothetical protein
VRRRHRRLAAALILLSLIAACGAQPAEDTAPRSRPTPSPTVSPPSAVAVPAPTRLLFGKVTDDGVAVIYEADPAGSGTSRLVADTGRGELQALTGTPDRVVWAEYQPFRILSVNRPGADRQILYSRKGFWSGDIVIAGNYVYFGDRDGVSRVSLDGEHLDEHFIGLPRMGDGPQVEHGLATDGQFLYFAQCFRDSIGRVPLLESGKYTRQTVIWVTDTADCPQGLDYSNGYLYYTTLDDVGRVSAEGGRADNHWSRRWVRRPDAFEPIMIGSQLFWDWGGSPRGAPSWILRIDTATGVVTPRFIETGGDVIGSSA